MKLLAIDTSTERASLALLIDGNLHQVNAGEQRQHAQLLLPAIEQLFASANLSLSQLDGIAFNRGPGSFTGLRIACSVAKGLAYAQDLPLYPVSSLAAIANELLQQQPDLFDNYQLLTMMDARMQQVYWANYNDISLTAEENVSDMADVVITANKQIMIAGVGYQQYLSQLNPVISEKIAAQHDIYPTAAAMLRLVANGEISAVSAEAAMPIYVRDKVTQGEKRG